MPVTKELVASTGPQPTMEYSARAEMHKLHPQVSSGLEPESITEGKHKANWRKILCDILYAQFLNKLKNFVTCGDAYIIKSPKTGSEKLTSYSCQWLPPGGRGESRGRDG